MTRWFSIRIRIPPWTTSLFKTISRTIRLSSNDPRDLLGPLVPLRVRVTRPRKRPTADNLDRADHKLAQDARPPPRERRPNRLPDNRQDIYVIRRMDVQRPAPPQRRRQALTGTLR